MEVLFDCYRMDVDYDDVPVSIVRRMTKQPYLMSFITSIPQSAVVESKRFSGGPY